MHRNVRSLILALLLCLALATGFVLALCTGGYTLEIGDILSVLAQRLGLGNTTDKMHDLIVWNIRMPRLLLACVTGMAMAASGAVYQSCFRNPLVEP